MRFFLPDLIVNKIWGKPVPTPTAGEDGQYLKYNNSTGAFVYDVTAGPPGPQGPQGSQGPQGDQGPPGSSSGAIGLTIDGGGSAITTGVKGYVTVPFACTISRWYLSGSPSGSIVIDVWKVAGGIPTVANTIAGTEKPTLASGTVANDTSLSSWTTSVSAGDVIGFNVDSCSGCKLVTVVLAVTK